MSSSSVSSAPVMGRSFVSRGEGGGAPQEEEEEQGEEEGGGAGRAPARLRRGLGNIRLGRSNLEHKGLVIIVAPNCAESKGFVTLNMERTMCDLMSASRSFTFLAMDWRAAKHSACKGGLSCGFQNNWFCTFSFHFM